MIQLKDIKEAVAEIMNEIDYNQLALDNAADAETMRENSTFWSDRTEAEQKLLKIVVQLSGKPEASDKSFTDVVLTIARNTGMDPGEWPTHDKAWKGDIKFYPKDALNWICNVAKNGLAGAFGNMIIKPSGECPASWGAQKIVNTGGTGKGWWNNLDQKESQVLNHMKGKILNGEYCDIDFAIAAEKAAGDLGINPKGLRFMQSPGEIEKAKDELMDILPRIDRSCLTEAKDKKRGFGEGEPPPEEIYKKREIVQEVDLEAPDAAQELGDAAGEQGEAGESLSATQKQASEAAAARKQAVEKWKASKETQIKAVTAAEGAAEEIQAAAEQAEQAAAAQAKGEEKRAQALDIAKQAHGEEKEAMGAAQEAAASEEEALDAMSQEQEKMAAATQDMGDQQQEFGDTLASDEEAKEKEEEESAAAEDVQDEEAEQRKAEQEADADSANSEREANDNAAAADAEIEDDEEEEEPQPVPEPAKNLGEVIKTMIREVISERKWGDPKGSSGAPIQKLQKAGLTADDLRSMVLNTVMKGEEERDMQMIKVLQDMLKSLQSIEYHTSPTKGAASKADQTAASQWVSESKMRSRLNSIGNTITEMRRIGMHAAADDHESFFRWILANPVLTLQEIKNEADAQISDVEAELQKLEDQYVEEDPFLKQKAEVPGHHN